MKILAWPAFKNKKLNPYNAMLYEAMQSIGSDVEVFEFSLLSPFERRYDVFHVHWPEHVTLTTNSLLVAIARAAMFLSVMFLLKVLRTRTVWTVHNHAPHEGGFEKLNGIFRQLFETMVDSRIFLTRTSRDAYFAARSILPRDGVDHVIPHGHYRPVFSESTISTCEARKQLQIDGDGPVFLSLGQMRPYKNIESLVKAFRQLDSSGARLVLAGKTITDEYERAIREEAQGDPRIKLFLEFVSKERVELLFRASDIFVIPFRRISNSGSVFLALTLSTPIALPKLEVFEELQESVGEDWIYLYDGDFDASCLSDIVLWHDGRDPPRPLSLDQFDWPLIAKMTLRAYQP